jgi:hypothetical protein
MLARVTREETPFCSIKFDVLVRPHSSLNRGELADIVVMEGRGFGFVTYADPKNAATFLESTQHTIGGCLQDMEK